MSILTVPKSIKRFWRTSRKCEEFMERRRTMDNGRCSVAIVYSSLRPRRAKNCSLYCGHKAKHDRITHSCNHTLTNPQTNGHITINPLKHCCEGITNLGYHKYFISTQFYQNQSSVPGKEVEKVAVYRQMDGRTKGVYLYILVMTISHLSLKV